MDNFKFCPYCGKQVGVFNSPAFRCTSCGAGNICSWCKVELDDLHNGFLCPTCANTIQTNLNYLQEKEKREREKIRTCGGCFRLYSGVIDSEDKCPHCRTIAGHGVSRALTDRKGKLLDR